MPLPKPPVTNMTEFVVFVFVTIVAIMLIGSVTTLIVLSFTDPDGDRSGLVNILTDTMNTIIGALIGFVAGKGQGRSEVHDEIAEREAHKKEDGSSG